LPHRAGIAIVVAAESVAGANTCELLMPLSEVIVTAVSVVGSVKVVDKHGLEIVMVKPIWTWATDE
jgi:dTDP-4-amino-4,6-dideoxygalactose transaminase